MSEPNLTLTPIQQLEQSVRSLSKTEFEAFRLWFIQYENELWDEQIARDSFDANSPIMKMAAQAVDEHKRKKSKKL